MNVLEFEFYPSQFKTQDDLEIFYLQKFQQFSKIEKKNYITRLPKMSECFINTCYILRNKGKIGFQKVLKGMNATEERKNHTRSIQFLPSFNFCFQDGHFIKKVTNNSRYYKKLIIRIVQSNNPCGFVLIHFFKDKKYHDDSILYSVKALNMSDMPSEIIKRDSGNITSSIQGEEEDEEQEQEQDNNQLDLYDNDNDNNDFDLDLDENNTFTLSNDEQYSFSDKKKELKVQDQNDQQIDDRIQQKEERIQQKEERIQLKDDRIQQKDDRIQQSNSRTTAENKNRVHYHQRQKQEYLKEERFDNEDSFDTIVSKLNKKITKYQEKQQKLYVKLTNSIDKIVDQMKQKYKNKQKIINND